MLFFNFFKKFYLYTDQFIFCSADSKLYGMSDTDLPVGIGPDLVKMIPGFVPMLFKLAVLNRGLSVYRVGTGYIQTGSKEANIPTSGTIAASFPEWQSH